MALFSLYLSGCGAGTGQSLNSPSLTSRSSVDTVGTGSTKSSASSVLPAKRLGLFVTDYIAQKSKTAGATEKPATLARTENTLNATEYAHVFVTLHKVELVSADDQTFPIWTNDAGRVVDLATLRDATGERLALLGGVPAPGVTGKKTYKRARITLGNSMTFLKRGETSGKPTPLDDAIGRDDEGRRVLTVLIDRPRDLGNGKEDLILAFDRSAFVFAEGRVTPSVREARGGISTDPARQEPAMFVGTVSEATAGGDGPERVFALTPDAGARGENFLVWLRSSAPFFRADGKPSPTLTDGGRVAVRGRLQPSTKRVLAESVAVLAEGEKPGEVASVIGTPSNANAEGGSFTVAVKDTRRIEPAYAEVTVTLGEGAVLRSASGLPVTKDEFFAGLKRAGADEYAEAEGDYEPTTGVLTASRVRLTATTDDKSPRETSLTALAKTVNEKSLTVTAPLVEWDGIVPPASGKAWTVNTSGATVCRDKDGKTIALADLLTAAKDPDNYAVHVVGTYAGGAIAATRLELRPAPEKEVVAKKTVKGEKDTVKPDADTVKGGAGMDAGKEKTNVKEASSP
ncbi:MAG: hypothetical protein H8F28_22445 [Fibrella sp.]|nr:hypothetical protein [Armatimonadota bacterium]